MESRNHDRSIAEMLKKDSPEDIIRNIISGVIHDGEEYIAKHVVIKLGSDANDSIAEFLINTTSNPTTYVYMVNRIAQEYNLKYQSSPITEADKARVKSELDIYTGYNGEIGVVNSKFFRMEKLPEILDEDLSLSIEEANEKRKYKTMIIEKKEKLR